jgi:hypothetical protein
VQCRGSGRFLSDPQVCRNRIQHKPFAFVGSAALVRRQWWMTFISVPLCYGTGTFFRGGGVDLYLLSNTCSFVLHGLFLGRTENLRACRHPRW